MKESSQRESIIRELLNGEGSMAERVAAAAEVLDISTRTVRRLVKQYRTSSQTTSLVPKPSGPHQKRRRLARWRDAQSYILIPRASSKASQKWRIFLLLISSLL